MIKDCLNIQNYKNNKFFNYYDKEYDKYYLDLGINGSKEKVDHILSFVTQSFNSIVDIGCGSAICLKELSKNFKCKKSVGTDISMFILKEAQKQNPTFDFYRANSENLPFKNKEFDVSLIIDVLEHVEQPDKVLEEAKRISNYIIIKAPIEDCWFINLYKQFIKLDWRMMMGHINFYSVDSFKKLTELYNLKLIKYYIPKQIIKDNLNWKMSLLNIGQWVTNILPEFLRVRIFPTEFYGYYEVQ